MRCPNCNYTFGNGTICPECGMDAVLYKKTRAAANKLYNKGLAQARINDLSGSVESLNQSIMFNKKNFQARNLLGLVYYEKGHIADALKQWIISSSLNKEDEVAKKYIDSLQKNARTLEKTNDSVRMYNQAIVYLNQNSEDLAIIQLKKAIDFNPKFVEAYNLLSLSYIMSKDIEKAKNCIDTVLAIDINNPTAIYYANEIDYAKSKQLGGGQNSGRALNPGRKINHNSAPFRRVEKPRAVIGKTEIIAFFVGIVCTTAVLLTLIMPAWVDGKDKKISELEAGIAKITNEKSEANSSEGVLAENEKLKAEIEKYKEEAIVNEKLDKINQALALSEDNKNEEAALLIGDLDTTGLDDQSIAKYNSVKEQTYAKASQSFYNSGKSDYLNENYDEASGSLENALKFANGESFVDDSLYYLGKIAQSKGDIEKAKQYYERVINEYPNSNQIKNVRNSLASFES